MENYLRMAADLPERDPESSYMSEREESQNVKPSPSAGDGDDGDPEQPEDKEE
jgi:hypothetical protein